MQTGHLRHPFDPGEAGEIDKVILVAQCRSARRGFAETGPQMERVALIAGCAGQLDVFAGRPVEFQLQVGIRHGCGSNGGLGTCGGRFPLLA